MNLPLLASCCWWFRGMSRVGPPWSIDNHDRPAADASEAGTIHASAVHASDASMSADYVRACRATQDDFYPYGEIEDLT